MGSMLSRFIDLSSGQQITCADPKTRAEYAGTDLCCLLRSFAYTCCSLRPFGDTQWRNPLACQQLATFNRTPILSSKLPELESKSQFRLRVVCERLISRSEDGHIGNSCNLRRNLRIPWVMAILNRVDQEKCRSRSTIYYFVLLVHDPDKFGIL